MDGLKLANVAIAAMVFAPAFALVQTQQYTPDRQSGDDNPTAATKLGVFQLALLLEIEQLGPDAYPTQLARTLTNKLRRHVSIGQVFVALERLEDRGFVSHANTPPQPVRGGRSRKLFRLEEVGRRAVREITTAVLTSPPKEARDVNPKEAAA
jgi:PadR family transcriptional regulator PadR